jgi:hypothetical protein
MDPLRTRSEDIEFHRSRRMFCVRDGEIKVAPHDTAMSHLEWFEAEGWVSADDQQFMDAAVRGVFIPKKNAIFLYRGRGLFFDDDLIAEANRRARQLQIALMLDTHVMVYAGPADAIIRGRRYEQRLLGTIESLTRRS